MYVAQVIKRHAPVHLKVFVWLELIFWVHLCIFVCCVLQLLPGPWELCPKLYLRGYLSEPCEMSCDVMTGFGRVSKNLNFPLANIYIYMPCFFIYLQLIKQLVWGSKVREGRLSWGVDRVARVRTGQEVTFQTWVMIVWWLVTKVDKFECAGDMLDAHGYKAYIPDALTRNDALRLYYHTDPQNKGKQDTNDDVEAWDRGIRDDVNASCFSWAGERVRIRFVVRITCAHMRARTHINTHTNT